MRLVAERILDHRGRAHQPGAKLVDQRQHRRRRIGRRPAIMCSNFVAKAFMSSKARATAWRCQKPRSAGSLTRSSIASASAGQAAIAELRRRARGEGIARLARCFIDEFIDRIGADTAIELALLGLERGHALDRRGQQRFLIVEQLDPAMIVQQLGRGDLIAVEIIAQQPRDRVAARRPIEIGQRLAPGTLIGRGSKTKRRLAALASRARRSMICVSKDRRCRRNARA